MPVLSPATTDGRVAQADHQHYFGAVTAAGWRTLAQRFDIIIANNFGGFNDDMFGVTTALRPHPPLMGFYGKSVQAYSSELPLPENFHAHNPQGQRINIFSTSIWLMQADHPSPTPYTDPRGFTVSTFRDYRANEKWATIRTENNKFTTDPMCIAYLDSMSAYVGSGAGTGNPGPPVDWQHGGNYDAPSFNAISYTIGDATKSLKPAPGYWVMGNGLRAGAYYMGSGAYPNPNGQGSTLPSHIEYGIAENWFRDNGDTFAQMKTRAESGWCKDIDMCVHAQVIAGIGISCIANVFNRTANGSLANPNLTPAQIAQEQRFSVGIYMLGNRGKCYYTYVATTAGTADPESAAYWNPYFDISLGPALDNLAPATAYKKPSGVYERNYTNGKVLVNMSAGGINHTVAAGYKDLNNNPVGTTVNVPAYDTVVLLGAGVNPPPPPGGSGYTNLLTDNYARTVAPGGLGTADTGQTYSLQGTTTNYQTDGDKAIVTTPLNAGRRALPTNVNTQDIRSFAEFAFAELSVGDSQVYYIWVRQNSSGDTGYRLRCELTTGNQLQYRTQKVVANVVTNVGTLQTLPGTVSAGTRFKAQLQAYGINPTTLSYKLWLASGSEPSSWTGEDQDSQAEMQVANNGAWSMFIQASNTNAPADIYVYQFIVDQYVNTPAPPPNNPPVLNVLSPNNGDSFDADINATAKFTVSASATDPDAGDTVTKITYSLNGATEQNLSLDAASQVWSRLLVLSAGSYDILITAYDSSGNTAAQTVSVTVNPYVPPAPPVVDSGGNVGAVLSSPIEEFVIVLADISGRAIGEIMGSDVRFGRYVKGSGFMSFESHRNHPLVKPSVMVPDAVDYSIQRNGVELQAGTVTDCDRDTDDEMVRVAGRDWKSHFEGLVLPFDPSQPLNTQDFHSGTSLDSTDDATNIVESLVAKVLGGYDNVIQVTMHNSPTGIVTTAHFLASDLADLRSMIQSIADQNPGFDWEITPDQRLLIHAPQKGKVSELVLDESNIKTVHFSPQGIQGNILYGRGSGTGSTQLVYRVTNPNSRALYRDRVVVSDFGEIRTKSSLKQATNRTLPLVSTQVVEFWVTMYPQGEDVWSQAEDGDSIYVKWNDGDIILDDYYRCNGFETFVNAQGDTEVTWHFDLNMDESSDG